VLEFRSEFSILCVVAVDIIGPSTLCEHMRAELCLQTLEKLRVQYTRSYRHLPAWAFHRVLASASLQLDARWIGERAML